MGPPGDAGYHHRRVRRVTVKIAFFSAIIGELCMSAVSISVDFCSKGGGRLYVTLVCAPRAVLTTATDTTTTGH